MATHSSTLAWKIPWAEEPGGLPSMGSHRVGHNGSDLAAAAAIIKRQISQSKIWAMIQIQILQKNIVNKRNV